jgi:ferric-dicitrate binding protein FerR (iron transport regulator)
MIATMRAVAVGLLVMLAVAGAAAQTPGACTVTQLENPPRQALDCGNGLLIEAEAGVALGLSQGEAAIDRGAVLVTIGSGTFQIRTPHAIASVRGTVYAVDAGEARTSVLVLEGEVAVARADGSDGIVLQAGQGADVAPGEPVVAQAWGAERIAALLARFGR